MTTPTDTKALIEEAIAKLLWERFAVEHEVEWPSRDAAEYRSVAADVIAAKPAAPQGELAELVKWLRCSDHEFCHEAADALEALMRERDEARASVRVAELGTKNAADHEARTVDELRRERRRVAALTERVAMLERALQNPPRHQYWGAGEPDCPREIKAGNGELHTLRCKVCGLDNPRSEICLNSPAVLPWSCEHEFADKVCRRCGISQDVVPDA